VFALAACSSTAPPGVEPGGPSPPPGPPAAAVLVWSDEFEGPAGTSFDRSKWTADTGGSGFGNRERQFYTTLAENVALDGNGNLVITARAEPQPSTYECWYGNCRYTSARLKTKGLFERTYGRFEARIRVPRGQGIWPAFWMLGADIDAAGWPQCGEIDIMEHIGREPTTAYGTLHGPGYSGAQGISRGQTLTGNYADDFHIFAVSWRPNLIQWFIDGREYHRLSSWDLPAGAKWVFDHPFFLLVNLAVGGAWPGDPDASTTFPQQLVVDYVRAYSEP